MTGRGVSKRESVCDKVVGSTTEISLIEDKGKGFKLWRSACSLRPRHVDALKWKIQNNREHHDYPNISQILYFYD